MQSHQRSQYEIFISYARKDNRPVPGTDPHAKGWVTTLRDQILEDHRRFSTEPLRIFFDTDDIRDMDDWRHRILAGLRSSKVLLVCLSPNYFASAYCRWEWEEYVRRQVHQLMGSDTVATVYFVEVPGSHGPEMNHWRESMLRGNFTDIRPWFPDGPNAIRKEEVQRRLAKLGESLWERIQRARRAKAVPGNLRRQNPHFVGRQAELMRLHEQLVLGSVGVVTAVHGLGGQGKTELAIAYAHGWADNYPAGLWVVPAEGHTELLPLIGTLASAPELRLSPTKAQQEDEMLLGRAVLAELERRAEVCRTAELDGGGAAILILDNVSEGTLLSATQLATLPRADWLRIVATTRLGPEALRPSPKSLTLVAVDSLGEDDALELVREHQPDQHFASQKEEAAARDIVRALGGYVLAVEQVAVYLGLHPSVAPSALLAALCDQGLARTDELVRKLQRTGQDGEILHQEKQLGLILETTLSQLAPPAVTALEFAALLPPDNASWPWLRTFTIALHPEIRQFAADEPDPWLETRRRLEGLRLLTTGDRTDVARMHRLVAEHVRIRAGEARQEDRLRTIRAFLRYRLRGESTEFDWDYPDFPPEHEAGALIETILHGISRDPSITQWMIDIARESVGWCPPGNFLLAEFAAAESLKHSSSDPRACLQSLLEVVECWGAHGLLSRTTRGRAGLTSWNELFDRVTELISHHPELRAWERYAEILQRFEYLAKDRSHLNRQPSRDWPAVFAGLRTS